jgi:hypothetical protein
LNAEDAEAGAEDAEETKPAIATDARPGNTDKIRR